jgi:NADPH-dependent curcumin reductase CurA
LWGGGVVGAVKMTEVNSYTKPYEEGQPMYGDTIAKVDLHTFSHPHPLII